VADRGLSMAALPDDELARSLRELAPAIAFPDAGPTERRPADLAALARRRIEALPVRRSIWQRLLGGGDAGERSRRPRTRPMRRGLVLALAALLVLAAVAGAVGLGLPGLRIIFGDGPTSPPTASATNGSIASPSIRPVGALLGLGTALPFDEVERLAGIDLLLPTDPDLGPPDVTYLDRGRAALVWTSRPGLPETNTPGVGLVLSEFRGRVDEGYFQKVLGSETRMTRVLVGPSDGFWLSGDPHFFMYIDPLGNHRNDDHRVVGDVLLWAVGDVTYRLETSLGMAEAIRMAESLR
jgi:hypothetical protein